MKVPDGITSVSFGGKEYRPDKKGVVDVPVEAAEALKSHGLTAAGRKDEEGA